MELHIPFTKLLLALIARSDTKNNIMRNYFPGNDLSAILNAIKFVSGIWIIFRHYSWTLLLSFFTLKKWKYLIFDRSDIVPCCEYLRHIICDCWRWTAWHPVNFIDVCFQITVFGQQFSDRIKLRLWYSLPWSRRLRRCNTVCGFGQYQYSAMEFVRVLTTSLLSFNFTSVHTKSAVRHVDY